MDFPVVLIYFEPKKSQHTIPTHKFCEMTAKEILRDALERNDLPPNKTKIYTLFIQSSECDEYAENSPLFRFSPHLKSKPIDFCNSLSFLPTTNNLINSFPPFFILIEKGIDSSSREKISFSIPVISKNDHKYMYTMPIIGLKYPFTVLQVKQAISKIFENHDPQNDVELYDIIGRTIDQEENCSNLASYLQKGRVFATFEFSKKDYILIQNRENAIKEILDSENKYATFLKSFEKNVKPFFEECTFLKSDDYKDFFDCFAFLPNLHAQILEKVKKLKSRDFMSRVGSLYNPYALMLKIYSDFNTQYKIIDKKIKELKSKPQNMKYFEEFQKRPFAEGRDISQILSTPFQQAIRYPLLFGRLLEYTPETHPDSQMLQQTILKMKQAMQNNDKRIFENESISKINLIQQNLTQRYNLIEADRRYIASYVVYYGTVESLKKQKISGRSNTQSPSHLNKNGIKPSKSFSTPKNGKANIANIEFDNDTAQQCIIILFTNLILIVRKNHSNKNKWSFTILSDIPINLIGIHPYGERSIFYDIPENKICSTNLNQNNNNLNIKDSDTNSENIKYETMIVSFQTAEERDKFFKKYRKNALSEFEAKSQRNFSIVNKKGKSQYKTTCFEVESLRPRKTYFLRDHSITFMNNAVWIFGGINNKNELQNKLHRILLSDRSVSYHKSDPINDIPPRSKALMVGINDHIYVFGGTNGDIIFNDLWCYSCKRFKWKQIISPGKNPFLPPPSLSYTMNYFESQNMLILIGGHQEFGVYLFQFETNSWGSVPLQKGYVPRNLIGHQTIAIDKDTFAIIGGQISNHNSSGFQYNNAILIFKPLFPDGISIVNTTGFQPMNISFYHAAKISKHFIIAFGKEKLTKIEKQQKNEQIFMFLLNLVTKKWSVMYQNPRKENKHFYYIQHDAFTFDPPDLNIEQSDDNDEIVNHVYFFGGLKHNNEFQTNLFKCNINISDDEIQAALSEDDSSFSFTKDGFLTDILVKKDVKEFGWFSQPISNPLIQTPLEP